MPSGQICGRGTKVGRSQGECRTLNPRMTDRDDAKGSLDAADAATEPALDPSPSQAEGADTEQDSPSADSADTALKRTTLTEPDGSPSAPPPGATTAYIGLIVDGRYQIQELLAAGGMGVVYKARHRIIDKPVALKILRPELANNREITQRFLTEAQAASSIGNEHIVDITDYGELPDGATYIVMEYLDGESLGHKLDQRETLSEEETLHIGKQVVEGLTHAHAAGIIHRDLKPDNIFLIDRNEEQFVKILDFGIAKVASAQNSKTRAGRVFGTPYYMSPEQAGGKDLDLRTDIYSLGVMFYEMTAGRLPFIGDNPLGILTQHIYSEPPPLGENAPQPVSAGLEAIITKCLSKLPSERYGSMQALSEDMGLLSRGLPPVAIADLKAREGTAAPLLKRLATSKAPRQKAARWPWLLAATAVAIVAWFSPIAEQLGLHRDTGETVAETDYHTVALVLAPIDAHVFRGETDLGMMPINVRLPHGQRITLSVRRKGYTPRSIKVDGAQKRLLISLKRRPGAKNKPAPAPKSQPAGPARTITFDGERTILPAAQPTAKQADAAVAEVTDGGGLYDDPSLFDANAPLIPEDESWLPVELAAPGNPHSFPGPPPVADTQAEPATDLPLTAGSTRPGPLVTPEPAAATAPPPPGPPPTPPKAAQDTKPE